MVTAIEAGLEVGKDSPRIDVDVRLVAVGGLATTIIASGVVGGGIFGTRVVTAVFGSVVATGVVGGNAVFAGVVGYLATACCRQQC